MLVQMIIKRIEKELVKLGNKPNKEFLNALENLSVKELQALLDSYKQETLLVI